MAGAAQRTAGEVQRDGWKAIPGSWAQVSDEFWMSIQVQHFFFRGICQGVGSCPKFLDRPKGGIIPNLPFPGAPRSLGEAEIHGGSKTGPPRTEATLREGEHHLVVRGSVGGE